MVTTYQITNQRYCLKGLAWKILTPSQTACVLVLTDGFMVLREVLSQEKSDDMDQRMSRLSAWGNSSGVIIPSATSMRSLPKEVETRLAWRSISLVAYSPDTTVETPEGFITFRAVTRKKDLENTGNYQIRIRLDTFPT